MQAAYDLSRAEKRGKIHVRRYQASAA